MHKTTKHIAVKKLETELKEEKHAEKQRCVVISAERCPLLNIIV
jgi:rRNA-processing protein CGR1